MQDPTDLERSVAQATLDVPTHALDYVMARAYQLYQADRYAETEILCRGLIAADRRYWWAYSLYAAALHRQGRHEEALLQINNGLQFEPGQLKLLARREEILSALGYRRAA